MRMITQRTIPVGILFALGLFYVISSPAHAQEDVAKTFKYTCGSCHSIGKGKMVGPDLKDVSTRRSKEWIVSFIKSSQTMIKNGDPEAVQLFNEYNKSVMPDHPALQDQEIDALIAYIDEQSSILNLRADPTLPETDRALIPKARTINVESISINDPMFKLLYWITAIISLAAIFTIGWYIARLSQ